MAKLTFDLAEGGFLSLEGKGEFIEVSYRTKETGKTKVLGLLSQTEIPQLRSFIENSFFPQTQVAMPFPIPPTSSIKEEFADTMKETARDIAREVRKIMEHDEDEDQI